VIYLEPRKVFDAAIILNDPVVYNFDKLIEVMMEHWDWDYIDALEWYCYNIEPLKYKGLKIKEEGM
jgi:hypothetical protein